MNRQQPEFGLQTRVCWPLLYNRGKLLAAHPQLTALTQFSQGVSCCDHSAQTVLAVGLHIIT